MGRLGFLLFRGSMALPTLSIASRQRSGEERFAEALGGDQKFRILMARLASSAEMGGTTRLEIETEAGTGRVLGLRLLHGGPLW